MKSMTSLNSWGKRYEYTPNAPLLLQLRSFTCSRPGHEVCCNVGREQGTPLLIEMMGLKF